MSGIISDNVGRASGLVKAAGGGGSMTFLATIAMSSQATATFDGYFTSDYDVYEYQFSNILCATNDGTFDYRVRISSSDASGSYYYGATRGTDRQSGSNGDINEGGWAQTTGHLMHRGISSTATYTWNANFTCYNPLSTASFKYHNWQWGARSEGSSPTHLYSVIGAGGYESTSALTGHTFSNGSGDFASGRITLWGLKHS